MFNKTEKHYHYSDHEAEMKKADEQIKGEKKRVKLEKERIDAEREAKLNAANAAAHAQVEAARKEADSRIEAARVQAQAEADAKIRLAKLDLLNTNPEAYKILQQEEAEKEAKEEKKAKIKKRFKMFGCLGCFGIVVAIFLGYFIAGAIYNAKFNPQADQQYEELTKEIKGLGTPTEDNYQEKAQELLEITWIRRTTDFEGPAEESYDYESEKEDAYLKIKRAYAESLKPFYGMHKDEYGNEESNAPDYIADPEHEIDD